MQAKIETSFVIDGHSFSSGTLKDTLKVLEKEVEDNARRLSELFAHKNATQILALLDHDQNDHYQIIEQLVRTRRLLKFVDRNYTQLERYHTLDDVDSERLKAVCRKYLSLKIHYS